MKAYEQILAKLEEAFAPFDAKVLEGTQQWAKERVAAYRAYRISEEGRAAAKANQHKYYATVFAIAGGKSWYNKFEGRNDQMIEELVVKHCAAIAKARSAKIAAKLIKANITEIESVNFAHTHDGFNGVFSVNTDQGKKRVTIDTILAGGYNIQCLHFRVLVNVK